MSSQKNKNSKLDWILHLLAALLMPSILLFDLFNSNKVDNHIEFTHVLLFAGIFGAVGILLFLALKLFTKRLQSALIVSVLSWISFWFFEAIFEFARDYSTFLRRYALMSVLVLILIMVAYVLRRYRPKYADFKMVFTVLAVFLIGFWAVNFVPSVTHEIFVSHNRSDSDFSPFDLFKTEFNIDRNIDRPDIYWFHVDGMMNLETYEEFTGENMDWLREELVERGFLIYDNAFFKGGSTTLSMPMLTSPYFYDNFFSEITSQHNHHIQGHRQRAILEHLSELGIPYHTYISNNWEILNAFEAAGYRTALGFNSYPRYSSTAAPIERLKNDFSSPFWTRFNALPDLLNLVTPLMLDTEIVALSGEVDKNKPTLTWNLNYESHPAGWRQFGDGMPDNTLFAQPHEFYHLAFNSGVLMMLREIDLVLEQNPNAVIILQSDHGFHTHQIHYSLERQGYSPDQIRRLNYSVFSAARIPDQYGGLEEPIHPLNITRVLVNRFVGEGNYELLD